MNKAAWMLGLGALSLTVGLRADAELDETMKFFQEEAQVATATKYKVDLKDAPASIQVITARDIAEHGYRNLAEALSSLTGLFIEDDHNYQYLGVRGLNVLGDYGSRVLILVDGNSVNDPIWGQAVVGNEGSVDIALVKRIEVVMGPGSSVYGSHAMFAVVNVITKTGEDIAAGGAAGGSLEGGYGSYNTSTGRFQLGGKTRGGFDYAMGGAMLGSSGADIDFQDPAVSGYSGLVKGADGEDAAKALLKLSYKGLSLESTYVNRQKWIPTAAFGTDFGDPNTSTVDGGWLSELKWTGALTADLDLLVRAYVRDTWFMGDYQAYNAGYGNIKQLSDASWGGSEVQFNWNSFQGNHVTFGGEVSNAWRLLMKDWSDLQGSMLDATESYSVSSGYVQDLYKPVEILTVVAGLRFDHYTTFGDAWSPRAGLLLSLPGDNTVKLLWGTAFNAPGTAELYWTDNQTELGNPDLKPERLMTYEVVWQDDFSKHLGFTVSGYDNTVTDMISMVDDPAYALPIYENFRKVITKGGDVTVHGDAAGLRYSAGYCYQQSVDDSSGLDLANSARDSGHLGLSWGFLDRKLVLASDAIYTGLRQTYDGYWVAPYLSSDVTVRAVGLIPHVDMTLKVRNAFDSVYSVPMGEMPSVETAPGDRRSYEARASLLF